MENNQTILDKQDTQSDTMTLGDFMAETAPKNDVSSYDFNTQVEGYAGNIDLKNRPIINNPDGSFSTEKSFSFRDEKTGKEVLIPSIVNGKELPQKEAIDHYYKTGENLGIFDTPQEADAMAMKIHERGYSKNTPNNNKDVMTLDEFMGNPAPENPGIIKPIPEEHKASFISNLGKVFYGGMIKGATSFNDLIGLGLVAPGMIKSGYTEAEKIRKETYTENKPLQFTNDLVESFGNLGVTLPIDIITGNATKIMLVGKTLPAIETILSNIPDFALGSGWRGFLSGVEAPGNVAEKTIQGVTSAGENIAISTLYGSAGTGLKGIGTMAALGAANATYNAVKEGRPPSKDELIQGSAEGAAYGLIFTILPHLKEAIKIGAEKIALGNYERELNTHIENGDIDKVKKTVDKIMADEAIRPEIKNAVNIALDKEVKPAPTGEKGNINQNLIPGVTEIADNLQKTHEELTKTFTPYNKGEEGKFTAETLRENLGQMARSHDKMEVSLSEAKNLFDKTKPETNIDFMNKMELGIKQDNPDRQKIADTLRNLLDAKRKEVQDLGAGKLENFIENYFPHIWEQPDKAQDIIRKIMGKRPFQGSKSFLKQRTIESIKQGIDAGLKPVSYNPIDLVILKVREMDRYIMANKTMGALKEQGIAKFVKIGGEIPEGFVKINDNISDVYSRGEKGELILRGKYYAQEDAARIINNYLSPGLRGNYFYDIYRGAGNTLNQFQLGLSAFHLGFTSMDATISKFALGINKLSKGDVLGAGKEFINAPFAPITNFLQGRELLQAWYGKDKGEMTNLIADYMASAGGRAKMDKFYATEADNSFKKALQEGKILTATLKVPWMIVNKMSKPIMEYIVPRQKMGVFVDLVKMELEKNPDISHEELRTIAQKAWDSVDNRMGQLVYDNLFWNKVTKDLSMASVRSLGWNLGTIRELGGAGKDTVKMLDDMRQGKNPEVSYRMAYALALPIVTGLYGVIYQYLHTGKGPEELKDYFFPKTGALDKNGEPARVSLPTYMKDLYHYTKAPVRTILNKFNPVNNTILQMFVNKDFYGTQIRNADDPAIQQILSEAKFLGTQFIPFGIRNLQRDTRKTPDSKVEPFIGITPAHYDVNMTKAEIKAQEYMRAKVPVGARTQEATDKAKLKADLRNNFKETNDLTKINQAIQEGKITKRDANEIRKSSRETPLDRYVKHLTVYELANVIKVATEDEKKTLIRDFREKWSNKYNSSSREEREKLKILRKEIMGD